MAWLKSSEQQFIESLSSLSYCNPFLPERMQLERRVLGSEFDDGEPVWSRLDHIDGQRANVQRISQRVEPLAQSLRQQLSEGAEATDRELTLYEDLIHYLLYYRFRDKLAAGIEQAITQHRSLQRMGFWKPFLDQYNQFLTFSDRTMPSGHHPGHMFACFFQLRRAFHHIFHFIVGRSLPAAQLRAAVWQSIFTRDMRRFQRMMFDCMNDFTTLVSGPSGTGKELVARAIGMSRYIPFDEERAQFQEDFAGSFHPLNLCALSPTLIESELFGHCRGAFTGAVRDRIGWLEVCSPLGTVFLDEIGELDGGIQVKLLRVLQTRLFQRLGESTDRHFRGKIIAATNRDLATEMRAGRFREDFYYRLCSDIIMTPSLQQQLADSPEDLHHLILFIARRVAGDEAEAVTCEVETWIEQNLGRHYAWPGNIRELEQCVRNVMIRGHYSPPVPMPGEKAQTDDSRQTLLAAMNNGSLTADELLRRYCTMIYAKLGSYEQTARQLGLDRRTVKSKVDEHLLAQIKAQ